jgi:hypothetical protein
MALHINSKTTIASSGSAHGLTHFVFSHDIFQKACDFLGSCLAAKPQHAHDNHYNGELEADPPAHQLLRPIRAASPQHVDQPQQKHDRDRANADCNNKITCEMHFGAILGNKTWLALSVPERLPYRWTHLIEKEPLRFKELEHVLIEKVEQLFRNML